MFKGTEGPVSVSTVRDPLPASGSDELPHRLQGSCSSICNGFLRCLKINHSESIKRKRKAKVICWPQGAVRESHALWKLSHREMSNTERKQMYRGFHKCREARPAPGTECAGRSGKSTLKFRTSFSGIPSSLITTPLQCCITVNFPSVDWLFALEVLPTSLTSHVKDLVLW